MKKKLITLLLALILALVLFRPVLAQTMTKPKWLYLPLVCEVR